MEYSINKNKLQLKNFVSSIMDFSNATIKVDNNQKIYRLKINEFKDFITISISGQDETQKIKLLNSNSIFFKNMDEQLDFFYGLKYDFSELIIDEHEEKFSVSKHNYKIMDFINQKLDLLQWKDIDKQHYHSISSQITIIPYMTSSEVVEKLRVSDQTLSNWRKKGLLEFKRISQRKYLYDTKCIDDIFEHGISVEFYNDTEHKKPIKEIEIGFDDNFYKNEIIKLLKPFAFKIEEYKLKYQNFFLNFGNLGFASSPQVMISDDFQLIDVIKNTVLVDDAANLFTYLTNLFSNGLEPRIDTSKKIIPKFSLFYINNLKNE